MHIVSYLDYTITQLFPSPLHNNTRTILCRPNQPQLLQQGQALKLTFSTLSLFSLYSLLTTVYQLIISYINFYSVVSVCYICVTIVAHPYNSPQTKDIDTKL